MRLLRSISFLLVLLYCSFTVQAQESVRNSAKKELSGRIMVIPFEPKLYMGEIDQKINAETKWNFNQMREYFRHQLDRELSQKLKSADATVFSFYIDSAKTHSDLEFIYKSTTISFDPPDHPTAPTVENKKQSGIRNGQVEVEMSADKRFTNIKLSNPELIPFLAKKYKSQYFVFVNELDLKAVPDSYDLASNSSQREVTVHYTILDASSRLISAGAATAHFSSKVNDPKKIVSQAIAPVAAYIAGKLDAVIHPKPVK